MSALPGLYMTTALTLDALANIFTLESNMLQTSHYFILVPVWPTTEQARPQDMDLAHTLHTTALLLLLIMYIQLPSNVSILNDIMVSSCSSHWVLADQLKYIGRYPAVDVEGLSFVRN